MVVTVQSGRTDSRPTRRQLAVIVVVLVALLAVAGGWIAGERTANRLHVLTANVYVGDHQAGVCLHGWCYGISDVVSWVDAGGSLHEDGWPSCLQLGTYERIRFGEIEVSGPTDESWRQVVWVDCRGAVRVR